METGLLKKELSPTDDKAWPYKAAWLLVIMTWALHGPLAPKLSASKTKSENAIRTKESARATVADKIGVFKKRRASHYQDQDIVGTTKNTVLLTAGLHGDEVEAMLFLDWLESHLKRKTGPIYGAMKRYEQEDEQAVFSI